MWKPESPGNIFNSAVICMFMEKWAERERQWTPLEVEQYSHHFRHRLLERTEELLGTESEFYGSDLSWRRNLLLLS